MGTTAQKLTYTANAINGIKSALEERGIVVGNTPLGNYASLIESISTDGTTSFAEKTITEVTARMIEGITQIGDYAFYNQSDLTTIEIPDTVTSIGDYAFYNCTGLSSVIIPDGVTSIGQYAFRGCSGLTSVTIPDSVTSIGDYAFYKCSSLEYIYFNGYESEWNSISKGQEWDDLTGNYQVICWSAGLEFSSNGDGTCRVIGIGTCTDTALVIPSESLAGDRVTSIREYAFSSCSGLTSVTIPDSVTRIRESAFHHCSGLTSIVFGNGLSYIGPSALEYCSNLLSVTFLAVDPPTMEMERGALIFGGSSSGGPTMPPCMISVPSQSVTSYKTEGNWTYFAEYIQAIQS